MSYDIISIGDPSLDVFLQISDATVLCSLKKEACQICFNYADKIPVESLVRTIGGNAANNAVGSSRLGMQSAFWGIVGNDKTGEHIIEALKKEKVSREYTRIDQKQESNYSTVINYHGERTIFVYHYPRKYAWIPLTPARWVYFTSTHTDFAKCHEKLLNYIERSRARLVFNPGTFQLKLSKQQFSKIIRATALFIVNKEEMQLSIGVKNHHTIPEYITLFIKQFDFKGMVVVTDNMNGSYGYEKGTLYYCKPFPSQLIEATGAGDAYATACVAALQYNQSLPEAMRWGAINAASVVQKIGPQEGLLTLKQLRTVLIKNKNFRSEIIK
ncbi:MAG: carbohydrate kinase family protein [Parcubacteria group bacterium]|nr:carbohydrate kinase family protein [Parcubacteria group bacterium]